ncbi:MAG: hypothetical protein SPJ34_05040, partial [Candidatus Ornithospirochaeta sp.]|nr:hypothetical protein [Candidatus Ornithospirochaeta sp.]
ADAKKANFLSAQVKADLNSFDVPVAVTVYGKDVINAQKIGGKVEVAPVDALKVVAGGSYTISSKVWSVDASAEYAFDMATLAAKVIVGNVGEDKKAAGNESDIALGFDVSAKTKTLIPGAELSLAYAADDVLQKSSKALDNGHLGSLTAKCKVSF